MKRNMFKAWHKKYKYMSEVESFDSNFVNLKDGEKWLRDNAKIIQWTELCDKNMQHIYEGQIIKLTIKDKIYICQVKFEGAAFILACNDLPDSYMTFIDAELTDDCEFQVIGHIFTKPELLEKGE